MNAAEKLIQLRKAQGMSQESLAENIGVSRQAVSRWETGVALPDTGNILALSKLYNVSVDYLLNDDYGGDEKLPKLTKGNEILHTNLTKIAIIAQGACLNSYAQPWVGEGIDEHLVLIVKIVPLLLASVWMASNHRYERNTAQKMKNTKIELLYCLIMAAIAIIGYLNRWSLLTSLLLITVMLIYIFVINPKFMNRRLVKQKHE